MQEQTNRNLTPEEKQQLDALLAKAADNRIKPVESDLSNAEIISQKESEISPDFGRDTQIPLKNPPEVKHFNADVTGAAKPVSAQAQAASESSQNRTNGEYYLDTLANGELIDSSNKATDALNELLQRLQNPESDKTTPDKK
ncbi:MAG: hypothetical protein P4L74_06035 [Candidatus Doudnabacteria bacterium]|nr:hypothetical protein [Candidatus Doudnabacteria bacterium]